MKNFDLFSQMDDENGKSWSWTKILNKLEPELHIKLMPKQHQTVFLERKKIPCLVYYRFNAVLLIWIWLVADLDLVSCGSGSG
jgi:hypothetical protein